PPRAGAARGLSLGGLGPFVYGPGRWRYAGARAIFPTPEPARRGHDCAAGTWALVRRPRGTPRAPPRGGPPRRAAPRALRGLALPTPRTHRARRAGGRAVPPPHAAPASRDTRA